MAEIRTLGLKKIEIGDIASDGGVSTNFQVIGVTYKDTAELTQEDPELTEHYSEENDEPEEVISAKGKTAIKWSIMDSDPDTLVDVLGGEVTGAVGSEVWEAPAASVDIEKSIKITPKKGRVIIVPRARLVSKINYKLARTGIFLVEITATVLTPTKAGVAPMSMAPGE